MCGNSEIQNGKVLVGDLCEYDSLSLSGTQQVIVDRLCLMGVNPVEAVTILVRSPRFWGSNTEGPANLDYDLWDQYCTLWELTQKQQHSLQLPSNVSLLPAGISNLHGFYYEQPHIHQIGAEFWNGITFSDALKYSGITEGPVATFECPHCIVDPSNKNPVSSLKVHSLGYDRLGNLVVKKSTSGNIENWHNTGIAKCPSAGILNQPTILQQLPLSDALSLGIRPTGFLNYSLLPYSNSEYRPDMLYLRRYTSFEGFTNYTDFIDKTGLLAKGINTKPTAPIHVWSIQEQGILSASYADLVKLFETNLKLYWEYLAWLNSWSLLIEDEVLIEHPLEPTLLISKLDLIDKPYIENNHLVLPTMSGLKSVSPKSGRLFPLLVISEKGIHYTQYE